MNNLFEIFIVVLADKMRLQGPYTEKSIYSGFAVSNHPAGLKF